MSTVVREGFLKEVAFWLKILKGEKEPFLQRMGWGGGVIPERGSHQGKVPEFSLFQDLQGGQCDLRVMASVGKEFGGFSRVKYICRIFLGCGTEFGLSSSVTVSP